MSIHHSDQDETGQDETGLDDTGQDEAGPRNATRIHKESGPCH